MSDRDDVGMTGRLISATGETTARVDPEIAAAMFTGGICEACGQGQGARTDAPLIIDGVDPGHHGATVRLRHVGKRFSRNIYSEALLARLTETERAGLDLRPVKRTKRGGRLEFFELVGAAHCVSPVAVRGKDAPATTCRRCGWTSVPTYPWFAPIPTPKPPMDYVAGSTLPKPIPQVFAIGKQPRVALGFTPERWTAIRTPTPLRGIRGYEIGIVRDEDVDPSPPLRTSWE